MGCVVCATRGGQGSRAAQEWAIRHAQETDQRLVFLYVVNPNAVGEVDDSMRPAIEAELAWVAQVLVRVAQQRAARHQLETEGVVLLGDVREEIVRFLEQQSACMLVLGAPRGTTRNVFGDDAIEQFAQEIRQASGVAVEVARPEGEP
jgi:nucleotide-binding universal stress UspA family protein